MVNLSLNRKRLLKDVGRNVDEVAEQLVLMGIEVETVGEDEITVDVTPNRPDLLSQPGITRALQAFLGSKPGLREYPVGKGKLKVRVDPAAKDIRPYTACAVATKLELDEERLRELIEIQEKLHVTFCRRRKRAAIGVYPMDAISGNITFTALPPKEIVFRPLESEKEMTGDEILAEHPKGKEFAHLLKGLPRYPVFLDGKGKVLSMPPVINSVETGKVTVQTKEIFIEASGHDFRVCHEIVRMVCAALADMGASIHAVEVQYGKRIERTPDMSPGRQQFLGYYVNRRLGTDIRKEQLPALLARMGLGFEDGRIKETHYAIIPPYRTDFLHQIDVVEDIAIAYGYDNIPAALPQVATVAGESPMTLLADRVRVILAGHGLLEAKSYHLLGAEFQRRLHATDVVTLRSSVSEEYDSLRSSILACLLQALVRNRLHEYPQMLFEIGTVFAAREGVEERQHLGIALAGDADYTRIRQVVESLWRALGVAGTFSPSEDPRFLTGRCAALAIDGKPLGTLGELAPATLAAVDLAVPVAACELDLGALREALR